MCPNTRRAFLRAVGGVVTATGMASGQLPSRVDRARLSGLTLQAASETQSSSQTQQAGRSVDTTVKLQPGQHQNWIFDFATERTLTFDLVVRWGPKVDCILFPLEEYRAYARGYRARFIDAGSEFGTMNVSDTSVTLPPGQYALVLDNVDWRIGFPTDSGVSDSPNGIDGNASDGHDTLGVHIEFSVQ